MEPKQAIKDLYDLKAQIIKQDQNIQALKKQIDDKKFETDYENMLKQQTILVSFQLEWETALKEDQEALVEEMMGEIRKLKVERGYARITEPAKMQVMRNQIMAEIITNHDMDMQHPIARELSAKFGK